MSKTLIENKSAMLKDLKKAVNGLVYSPSLAKQEAAFDALASLNNFLESFEIPKEVKTAKKPKATKPKASKTKSPKPKATKTKSKSKAVRRPKRTSADGLELTQAKEAIGVGEAKKTKAVALDGSQAMFLEPRKEVLVPEPKARKKAVLEVFTLLDGETPQDAVRRRRIEQEKEQSRLEAEALMSGAPTFDDCPF
jgi:hypothetical protein